MLTPVLKKGSCTNCPWREQGQPLCLSEGLCPHFHVEMSHVNVLLSATQVFADSLGKNRWPIFRIASAVKHLSECLQVLIKKCFKHWFYVKILFQTMF